VRLHVYVEIRVQTNDRSCLRAGGGVDGTADFDELAGDLGTGPHEDLAAHDGDTALHHPSQAEPRAHDDDIAVDARRGSERSVTIHQQIAATLQDVGEPH